MNITTLIIVTVLIILLGWLAPKLPEPGRVILIGVACVVLLVVILRLLGVGVF
jgi:hypothetical protein